MRRRLEYNFYMYIMANKWRTIYAGVANDLERRAWQHKTKATPGFTAKYGLDQLVYFEYYALSWSTKRLLFAPGLILRFTPTRPRFQETPSVYAGLRRCAARYR